jgi:RND family efflux transporter MFP subunit
MPIEATPAGHPDPHGAPSHRPSTPQERAALGRRLKWAGLIGGVAAIAIVGWGLFARARAEGDMQVSANQRSVPVVRTLSPTREGAAEALELPGALQAYNDAPIYARVPGYVKSWSEDIGARVKAGQLLAVIDAPELDQQLAEAQANLATAQANLNLATITAKRFNDLAGDDAVSKQDADEKSGALAAQTAGVKAAQANVQRLQALEGFKRILAPFDGVVTQRNTNIGALVNAGAGAAPASSLFNVADVHVLRVYVSVPQVYSAVIRAGMPAVLALPQFPGRAFAAKVVSDAGSVNAQTGALLVELEVANPDGALKPGDYVQARFQMPTQAGALRVPASSLIFRRNGLQVAVLDGDRARLKTVSIARDFGGQVELSSGLAASDKVIDNPPDSLADGDVVRVSGADHAQG